MVRNVGLSTNLGGLCWVGRGGGGAPVRSDQWQPRHHVEMSWFFHMFIRFAKCYMRQSFLFCRLHAIDKSFAMWQVVWVLIFAVYWVSTLDKWTAKWLTIFFGKVHFAWSVYTVSLLQIVTLSKWVTECIWDFAEYIWYSANNQILVVATMPVSLVMDEAKIMWENPTQKIFF